MGNAPEKIPTPLEKSLQGLGEAIAKREASNVKQFPLWPDRDCGVPNEIVRSSLFAAIHAKDSTYLKNEEVTAHQGISIRFTGQRLNQSHLDVFEGVMHMARGVHEGNKIRFSAHKLLKLIGRSTGSTDHQWLYDTFQHLTATSVAVFKDGKQVFWGSLIPRGAGQEDTAHGFQYVVEINRDIINLFQRGFTQIDWEQRRALRRKPLACWLQLYYSSHAKPFPVTVEFIREQSGSHTASIRKFRQNLKAALDQIQKVGVIASWAIENDRITVERIPSASQLRSLKGTGYEVRPYAPTPAKR